MARLRLVIAPGGDAVALHVRNGGFRTAGDLNGRGTRALAEGRLTLVTSPARRLIEVPVKRGVWIDPSAARYARIDGVLRRVDKPRAQQRMAA